MNQVFKDILLFLILGIPKGKQSEILRFVSSSDDKNNFGRIDLSDGMLKNRSTYVDFVVIKIDRRERV
jgi:hypothetical protein